MKILALALLLLAGCRPYYIIPAETGIPGECWVTERTDTGFSCVDRYRRTWYCRWTPESKELDGRCSPAKPLSAGKDARKGDAR